MAAANAMGFLSSSLMCLAAAAAATAAMSDSRAREDVDALFIGGVRGKGSLENLHAMVVGVSHDDAPVAVDGDAATRVVELSVA